jgi:ornithine lipid ester-linked acyl 2-hydroxylase
MAVTRTIGTEVRRRARAGSAEALKALLRQLDRLYASSSVVGTPAFFDPALFPWTRTLEQEWGLIRAELDDVLRHRDHLPSFHDLSPEQAGISTDDRWKTFFFYAYGIRADGNCERCPETTRLLGAIPGLTTAFFSILGPRKRLPPHRGPYRGVIRYHLGLRIPEPATACGIRVGDEVRHWEEGSSLVFDDTYEHEAWNETDEDRAVLFVDFVRPLRPPASVVNGAFIRAIGLSPFVLGRKGSYLEWERRFEDAVNRAADGGGA